jgi:hypothetical protein
METGNPQEALQLTQVEKVSADIRAATHLAVLRGGDFEDCLGYPETAGLNPAAVLMLEMESNLEIAERSAKNGNFLFANAIVNAMNDRLDYADSLGVDTTAARKKLEDFTLQLSNMIQ